MKKHTQIENYQSGSAMVEFTLILGVILPVGLGIAMLGKLTDLQQTTEQAGRYSAWEATVYSRQALDEQQRAAVDERFFHAQDSDISSIAASGQASVEKNTLWGEPTAHAGSLRELSSVSRAAETTVASDYTFDTGKATASRISGKAVAGVGGLISDFKGNSWGLVADGLLRSSVDVAVTPTGLLHALHGQCGNNASTESAAANTNEASEKNEHVCVRSAGVILADGWSASSDAQAKSRVRSLVVASTMTTVGGLVSDLLGSILFPELDPLDKAFGYVDMTVLPEYAKP
ncbi:pilus assembly protein [Granulosicoccus sp.]|nr:pilus assembly protein [Granulosicoccus sp.]